MGAVLNRWAVLAGAAAIMANAIAMPENDSKQVSTIPLYYTRSERVTAQLLFPRCKDPVDAQVQEQCSLTASRLDVLETKLNGLCGNAGESILHVADNVRGIYVHSPNTTGEDYWHDHEGAWELFVSPTFGPHYKFWEVDRIGQSNKILNCRYETEPKERGRAKTREVCKGLVEPESRYGITWRSLTSDAEQRQDRLFGDELRVFNLQTNETLATRRIYFYVIRDNVLSLGGGRSIRTPGNLSYPGTFVRSCFNYSPKEDNGYVDKRPRHSVEFVARVLRPSR